MAGAPRIGDLQSMLAIDVQGLGALRAQAKTAPGAALEKVAGQFEALFMVSAGTRQQTCQQERQQQDEPSFRSTRKNGHGQTGNISLGGR